MSMSIMDAAYHTVHSYPGGAEALATRLDPRKSGTLLSHEVRPPVGHTAKLGVETAMQIVDLTGNPAIVHAVCSRAGGVFVALPSEQLRDDQVFPALSRLAKEFGDVVAKITEVAADGRVSDNDLRALNKEAMELVGAMHQALQILTNMNAELRR